MVTIKGRNIISKKGDVDPPLPGVGKVVTITVNLAPGHNNPKLNFTPLKYGKKAGFIQVKDDGFKEDYSIGYAYLKGGITAADGNIYPGIYFTDGAGKQIPYKMTFAINTATSKIDPLPANAPQSSWNQYKIALANGFELSNHTHQHTGYDKLYQLQQAALITYANTGFRLRTIVIPTVDEGYANTGPNLGYLMLGSSFGDPARDDFEGATPTSYGVYWGGKLDAKTFNPDKLLFNRYYSGEGGPSDWNDIKTLVDTVISESKGGNVNAVGHWFSHGLDDEFSGGTSFEYWKAFIQYIKNHPDNNDTVGIYGMQEFAEYYETRKAVIKTQTISGNVLKVTLDISNISARNYLRDMSLRLEGGSMQGCDVQGADDFTINLATGLVNVYKRNPEVSNPANDILPAQIISVTRSQNTVLLTYDKDVTQNVFSNSRGNAYRVNGNTVLSVTGSGKNWVVNCQTPVAAGSTLDYRMQRGNATDGLGLKVCTYIGFPIT